MGELSRRQPVDETKNPQTRGRGWGKKDFGRSADRPSSTDMACSTVGIVATEIQTTFKSKR